MRERRIVLSEIKSAIVRERESTLAVLRLLREIEADRHFLEMGYPSLFEFAVRELGYSAGAAHRRIQSMRLSQSLPEMEAQIEAGSLSLCVAAKTQSFFCKEDQRLKGMGESRLSIGTRREVAESMLGTSARECERKLVTLSPESALPSELTRPIGPDKTLIQFVAGSQLVQKLERLKALLSHRNFESRYELLFDQLADLALRKLEPQPDRRERRLPGGDRNPSPLMTTGNSESIPAGSLIELKSATAGGAELTPAVNQFKTKTENTAGAAPTRMEADVGRKGVSNVGNSPARPSRYIGESVKREVWRRDSARCTYTDPSTQRRCNSRHALEYDHIQPYAWGGQQTTQNLRLQCRAHNQFTAERMGLLRPA